jgi:hypothetical protein
MGARTWLSGVARPERRANLVRGVLALGYVSVKLTSPWNARPVSTGDSPTFAAIAAQPLWSSGFWLAERPFGFPLLSKLAGGSTPVLVWLQLLLGLGAWLLFAETMSRLQGSPWLSVLVFALTLLLALTSNVHVWDCILRSEALGLSLLVVCVAAVLRFLMAREREPLVRRWGWVSLACMAGFLAAFSRESVGYVLPILALVALAARWPRLARDRRLPSDLPAVVLAAGLVLASLGSQANTRASGRFAFPLTNVIFVRVLPNRGRLSYFVKRLGMPVTPKIQARAGSLPPRHDPAFMRLRDMKKLETWIRRDGYRGYQRYLLSHLGATARDALRVFGRLATRPMASVAPSAARAARRAQNPATTLADWIWLRNLAARHPYAGFVALTLLGLAGLMSRARAARLPALLALALLLAAATQAYICLHGDAMEVERHGLIAGVLLRLAVLPSTVLVLLGAPALVRRLRAARLRKA